MFLKNPFLRISQILDGTNFGANICRIWELRLTCKDEWERSSVPINIILTKATRFLRGINCTLICMAMVLILRTSSSLRIAPHQLPIVS